MEYNFRNTGFKERVDGSVDKIPEFDPRSALHYWIIITSYHINPETFGKNGPGLLDHESLVSTAGPVCYYCESPYSPVMKHRRCQYHP